MNVLLPVRALLILGLPLLAAAVRAQTVPDCTTATLTTSTVTAGANGTSASFSFTTPTACRWPAVPVSDSSWLTVSFGPPPGGTLTGGSIGYTATANNSLTPRTGIITVLDQQFTVNQSAQSACSYSFGGSSSTTLSGAAQSSSYPVVVTSGCTWTAVPTVSWISMITPGGSGSGSVQFQVSANTTTSSRVGQIQVGTLNFTVTQSPLTCTYSVNPSSASVGPSGASGSLSVTAASGCQWNAASSQPWLTVTSPAAGNGNGTVSYDVDSNATGQSRSATITAGTATFTLTQTASCTLTLSQSAAYYTALAATGTVTVTANSSSCDRSAATPDSWITISSGASATGSGTAGYSIAANNSGSQRRGTISFGGGTATLVIYQDASTCTYALAPLTQSVPAGGGTGSVSLQTACTWTALSSASWLTLNGATSGSGNGTVSFKADANTGATARSASISAGGQTVMVTQPGVGCNFSFSPASFAAPAQGGTVTIAVTVAQGCAWTAAPSSPWITLPDAAPGNGSGSVRVEVGENATAAARTGAVTIGGAAFPVSQQAAACTVSLSPSSASFGGTLSTGTFAVASNCDWTTRSSAAWLTITGGLSGSGAGTISFQARENGTGRSRRTTITVNDQAFNVTQTSTTCSITINPSSVVLAAYGGPGLIRVNGQTGCDWTAAAADPWAKVSWAAVAGSGVVRYTASSLIGPDQRQTTITIAGQPFTLTQNPGPVLDPALFRNAASNVAGQMAPGLIVRLTGTGLGPAEKVTYESASDGTSAPSSLAGTRVFFDDVPAVVLSTSDTEVVAVVPYSMEQQSATRVAVEYQGVRSNEFDRPMLSSAPGLFTIADDAKGQAIAFNADGNRNSASSPAQRNQVIQIIGTGEGQTDPPGIDGQIMTTKLQARPILPVSVTLGGVAIPANQIVSYGSVATMPAGFFQVSVRIPSTVPAGSAVPVVVKVGAAESQPGVTVAVR